MFAGRSYLKKRLPLVPSKLLTYNATVDNYQPDNTITRSKVKQERLLLALFLWEM
jgi:hypothetical protein